MMNYCYKKILSCQNSANSGRIFYGLNAENGLIKNDRVMPISRIMMIVRCLLLVICRHSSILTYMNVESLKTISIARP